MNVEIPSLSVSDMRRLKATDCVGTYTLFQETYHRPTFKHVHVRGPKSDYDHRLLTHDRAMRAGAVGFLPKSFDRGAMVASLRQLLGLPPDASMPVAAGTAMPGARTRLPGEAGPDDTWVHEALAGLSARQMQVLRLLLNGAPNKEICRELGVSENTVKIHIGSVLRALRARTRTEAVGLASRVGFGLG
jgi:DNA-binding NarL/FixJ family response regulator